MDKKKRIFSGIQPTGTFTMGNYMGAIRNWAAMQEEYDCIYSVVDLHAVTIRHTPADLRHNSLQAYAQLLACGIDPKRSILFIQSHVTAHAEMAWILGCYTPFGELSRMTQFKDKSATHPENINAGLFTYPVLQAADILLYQADLVPVGIDQSQHVELTRNVAARFNGIYGNVFTLPEGHIPKTDAGGKIMSLQDPTKKMSKSDGNPKAFVQLLDPPDTIIKKFKSAVTDSGSEILFREGKEGINNLITCYTLVTGKTVAEVEREFAGRGYGEFKLAVGEAVADKFRPIQDEFARLMADKAYLESCYKDGAEKASALAKRTMDKAYKKIGMIPR